MAGMRVSLVGMVNNALRDLDTYERSVAEARKSGDVEGLPNMEDWPCPVQNVGYHRVGLEQLVKHMRQLRDRTMAGDIKAIDEFFELYVFQDGVEFERPDERAQGWAAGRAALVKDLADGFSRKVRDGYDWNSPLGWAQAFAAELAEKGE